MPIVLNVDWAAIQASYLRGAKLSTLARQYGVKISTIRQRALRGQWRKQLQQAVLNTSRNVALDNLDKGKAWTTRMIALMEKRLEKLEQHDPEDLDSLRKVLDADDTADRIARRTLGLDDDKGKTTINVAVLDPTHVGRLNAVDATCVPLPKEHANGLDGAEIDSLPGRSVQERDPGDHPFAPDI